MEEEAQKSYRSLIGRMCERIASQTARTIQRIQERGK